MGHIAQFWELNLKVLLSLIEWLPSKQVREVEDQTPEAVHVVMPASLVGVAP